MRNTTSDAGHLGLMQMFPHSCASNCKVAIIKSNPGLELYLIESLVDIPVHGYPTFNYNALATETEKLTGETFWRWSRTSGPARSSCLVRACPFVRSFVPYGPGRRWFQIGVLTARAALLGEAGGRPTGGTDSDGAPTDPARWGTEVADGTSTDPGATGY